MLVEQSLVSKSFLRNFRRACKRKDIRIVAEASIAQTAQDVSDAVRSLHDAKAAAIVHCGFGFGVVRASPVLAALGWDPPRFTGTAFQNAWLHPIMWNALLGWTGIDQYDEENLVGQRFLDQFEAACGRRPEYCVPVVNRDVAATLLHALADAHPLSPRGREGVSRAREDAACRVRRSGHPGLARKVGAPGVGRSRLPRGAQAGPGRDPLSSRRPLR